VWLWLCNSRVKTPFGYAIAHVLVDCSLRPCGKHLRGVVLVLLADELDITAEAATGQPSRYEYMQ
jgi:hypothetical protein